MQSRAFNFPNDSYSVCELVYALDKLGETKVVPGFEKLDEENFKVFFIESEEGVSAEDLAGKLTTIGSRFNCTMEKFGPKFYFYWDLDDITNHPEMYL